MNKTSAKRFVQELYGAITRNQTTDLAAQLAFFSVLALFPFAVFLLTIVGFIPLDGLDQQITQVLYQTIPSDAARMIDETVHEVLGHKRSGLLIFGLLATIWSASGGMDGASAALNRAYGVRETRPYWKKKLVSLAVTAGTAILIVVAVVAMALGPEIVHWLTDWIGLSSTIDFVWKWARWPLILLSMSIMVANVYFFLPNVKQRYRLISPGSVTAVLLWVTASLGFKFYVSHFGSYSKTYGTLGAAVILLTWLYISGFVLILGGEINSILDRLLCKTDHTEKDEPEPASPRRHLRISASH